ncbi:MAG: hypothetical protein GEV10_10100 [Streptosporangiales bacterium]|nr:hypothetical protein [Streptosporangiales bacterium]
MDGHEHQVRGDAQDPRRRVRRRHPRRPSAAEPVRLRRRATVDSPDWYLWRDGVPPGDDDHPGESVEQVGARVDAVLERVRPFLNEEDVAIVAHGHVLRVLTACWLGLPPDAGRFFRLGTGTMSFLGAEHDRPVIDAWNIPPSG